jgi:hypothetical protein
MTAILTPALALRYLGELSTDVRAAVVLDSDGALVAGDSRLAAPAAALLATVSPGARMATVGLTDERGTRHGTALVARAAEAAPALVVLAGPRALLDLLCHDLATAADGISTTAAPASPPLAPNRAEAPRDGEFAGPAAISAGMALLHAVGPERPEIGR